MIRHRGLAALLVASQDGVFGHHFPCAFNGVEHEHIKNRKSGREGLTVLFVGRQRRDDELQLEAGSLKKSMIVEVAAARRVDVDGRLFLSADVEDAIGSLKRRVFITR